MNHLHHHELQSVAGTEKVSGCWKLGDSRALTLRPSQPGVLRIAHGRVWITFDHARGDDAVRGGDHFLGAGDSLQLLPGQALVMESWNASQGAAAYFSWDPLPASAGLALTARRTTALARNPQWRAGVLQPLRDLRLAAGLAATASGRLLGGLAGALTATLLAVVPRFAIDLVAGRARTALAARAFKAHSSESRAHCAIS
ncbi:DUF2917 domain-containing protein [Polaromonas sp.]|uniref:DUF2917 domain-containing protein n=1 Tax=Polaromonas sp. TaxID=1869339 RepID=UPI00248A8A56|nr:DUF2917 domain-containing protein [Polaromonas sp.]MDI1338719.1 DUF2917 domain-containing protein [Polaromonas sp.]